MRPSSDITRARRLRADMTLAERLLWRRLRRRALKGRKFRRQADIGRFVVDFLCIEHALAVEIDGPAHALFRAASDAARDRALACLGYRVLRLPEALVRERIEEALLLIECALTPPPFTGEGQESPVNGGEVFGAPESAFSANERRQLKRSERKSAAWTPPPFTGEGQGRGDANGRRDAGVDHVPPTNDVPPTPYPSPAGGGGEVFGIPESVFSANPFTGDG